MSSLKQSGKVREREKRKGIHEIFTFSKKNRIAGQKYVVRTIR